MARRKTTPLPATPTQKLEALVARAVDLAKTARRNHMSLAGSNYYANKLVELRADATNLYRELAPLTAGDSSALGELLERVFATSTEAKARAEAARELTFSLRTTWRSANPAPREDDGLFPLSILSQSGRGYLVTVGRQMNGCFSQGWYDASAVMMRRLLEIAIIEAFEAKGVAAKIKDANGDYLHLSDLVGRALGEASWTLSRNCKKALPALRDAGHTSAHGRYYHARREDLEGLRQGCRVVIEEFLHHAGLQ
ncbi:MAG TPA: DUF4145 domain-containing protein [Candidatus Polarisedimenticolaceae bacterium]|nr:DUF4145 domain-containing protein [Candidatus Polarisedimenticolaceae bacterium]